MYGPLPVAPLLPLWVAVLALHPRWRRQWSQRVGLSVAPVMPGCIWVHAASVGEVGAAFALIERLPRPILVTADTEAGVARALTLAGPGVIVSHKPVDHAFTLAPLWSEARPRALVFVEGTYWPALAAMARSAGVAVLRVSAKASTRTRIAGRLLGGGAWPADVILARDADAAAFFSHLYRGREVLIRISGDLKADLAPPAPKLRWSRPFSVVASARAGDVRRTLQAMSALGLDLQLLAAPRHPERFDLDETMGRRTLRRTEMRTEDVPADIDVLLLDTIGELAGEMAGARFAVIGGSFDAAIGGHSPLEARRAGVPVIAGPFITAQGDAFDGAAVGPDLAASIARGHPARKPPSGAADRAARAVLSVAGPPAPESSPRPWARVFVPLFRLGSALRDLAFERGLRPLVSMPVPVISVGSQNARSPGRTSTVRALTGALQERGHVVGVALRGYLRAAGGRAVHLSGDPARVGDEGALLHAAGALVAAGPDRVACARALVSAGATVIVLDDGLASRTLRRDLEIVVVDARFPGARGELPMGERRGPLPVPERAQIVLVHHSDARFSFPGEVVLRGFGPWQPRRPEGPVAAFAGIGRPSDFLASLDLPVARFQALPDHGAVDLPALLLWAAGLPLVCTAKDAARLSEAERAHVCWRHVEIKLPGALLRRLPPSR